MARGNNQSIERAAHTIRKINDSQNEIFIGVRMLLWGKWICSAEASLFTEQRTKSKHDYIFSLNKNMKNPSVILAPEI